MSLFLNKVTTVITNPKPDNNYFPCDQLFKHYLIILTHSFTGAQNSSARLRQTHTEKPVNNQKKKKKSRNILLQLE